MKISKTAWSQKRKNHLINLYALEPSPRGSVEIFNPPFSWDSNKDALSQINVDKARAGVPQYHGKLLQVVLDMSSGRLYLPNKESMSNINADPMLLTMYEAIRLKIEKLVDFLPMAPPINGDPLDTIRIRKIKDFYSVTDFIKRQSKDIKQFEKDISIPVLEVNMSFMPKTAKKLLGEEPAALKKQWLFVKGNKVVEFIASDVIEGITKDVVVCQQKAPFILINTSTEAKVSNSDKERIVISAYKEYAIQNRPNPANNKDSPQLQSFKYLMYIGWSFKELSLYMLGQSVVQDFREFISRGAFLYNAAKSLKNDGYPDPTINPYYYSFEIGNDFPVVVKPEFNVDVYDYSRQPELFRIVFFDHKTSFITVKTPLFIPDDVFQNVFLPKSPVFMAQYNPTEKTIKTNVPVESINEVSLKTLNAITTDVSNVTGKPAASIPVRERHLTELQFERKHISDYPQVTEIIKELCKKLSASPDKEARAAPKNIVFDDLEVVVGPWERIAGFLGGYVDARRLAQVPNKEKVVEPIPGFKVYPPVIMIDNSRNPSVGDRTNVIIHEYRHHINTQLWIDSPAYDVMPKENDTQSQKINKMVTYLKSPDERVAHKTQFKYMLAIGISKEQILRQLLHGKPSFNDIPVAKEYLGIINEAARELDIERDDKEVFDQMTDEVMQIQNQLKSKNVEVEFFDPDELDDTFTV